MVVPSSCIPRPFDNTDFNLPATSNSTYQGNGVFRLTPNVGGQGGAAWYRRRLDMRVNFRIAVELYLGASDAGADGMAFVLQNLDTGQGSTGGGLGYGGGLQLALLWQLNLILGRMEVQILQLERIMSLLL